MIKRAQKKADVESAQGNLKNWQTVTSNLVNNRALRDTINSRGLKTTSRKLASLNIPITRGATEVRVDEGGCRYQRKVDHEKKLAG